MGRKTEVTQARGAQISQNLYTQDWQTYSSESQLFWLGSYGLCQSKNCTGQRQAGKESYCLGAERGRNSVWTLLSTLKSAGEYFKSQGGLGVDLRQIVFAKWFYLEESKFSPVFMTVGTFTIGSKEPVKARSCSPSWNWGNGRTTTLMLTVQRHNSQALEENSPRS